MIDKIHNWLKENLSEERYYHSLGTANCAQELAFKYELNPEKAYLTGLLHDCAKCFEISKLEDILIKELNYRKEELINPKTFHAPASAFVAKKEFGIQDEEILSAIECHTVGKLDMSVFEKIIFLADKIEPNTRDKNYRNKILNILEEENGLNKALLVCYKETIKSLVDRELKICTLTIDIYNNLLTDNSQT